MLCISGFIDDVVFVHNGHTRKWAYTQNNPTAGSMDLTRREALRLFRTHYTENFL